MKAVFRRLGNPLAISWFSFAHLVVLQGSGSIVSSLANYDDRLLEFLAVRFAAFIPLGLVLVCGRFLLERLAVSSPRPFLTLFVLFLAISAGTVTFDSLLVMTGFTEEYVFPRRLITSLPGALTGSIFVSLLVTSAREQGRANSRLLSAADKLVALRGDIEKRMSERRSELVQDIRGQIEAQFARFGSGDAANASVVKDLIDDVVRPLSYSLAKRPRSVSAIDVLSEETDVAWATVFSRAFRANPFHWKVQPLILGAIGATFLVLNFGLDGAFATVGLMLMSGLLLALSQLMWPALPSAVPVTLRFGLFAMVTTAIAYVGGWIVVLVTGFSVLGPVKFPAWWVIVTVGFSAATLVLKVFRLLRATEERLSSTLKELRREVATLNTALRQLHKSISRILHGPVQEAVNSMLIGLEQQPERADSPEFTAQLRTRLENALGLLDSPEAKDSDPAKVVANLQELWAGAAEINLVASREDLDLIRHHQPTAYAVSEVVREACQNGLRHGRATTIDVEIELPPSNTSVEVRVRNIGIPVETHAMRGLGSQLFDDLCLQWARNATTHGTQFSALLPLISTPES